MISPKIKTMPVVISIPAMTEVRSDMIIESIEFTDTLPIKIVQISRFPLFLNGNIL
jgi:hypothetical protein